jgi:hypothetical protein
VTYVPRDGDTSQVLDKPVGGIVGRARALLVASLCLIGITVFARELDGVYEISAWLAWPVLLIWGYTLLLVTACVVAGNAALTRVLAARRLPLLETWLFALALGLVAFTFGMYLLGATGGIRPVPALLLPLALIAVGARDIPRLWVRSARAWRRARPVSPLALGIGAFGLIGCFVLYLIAFSPISIGFDASWYHFPVAHDYVRHGKLVPFAGDYVRTLPHLDSLLYAWGFVLPGIDTPFDWMLALHLEYAIVLGNALGIAVATKWMVRDDRLRGAWVALFLFPQVFAFGFGITGGADHFVGFWAVPMFMATARALPRLELRYCALLGAMAGGAVLSKYQAVYMIVACALLLVVRWCTLAFRSWRGHVGPTRRELVAAPLLVIGTALLVSAPHFVKNAIFYRNPLYPFAQSLFTGSSPTHPRAAELFENMLGETGNHPDGEGLTRVWNTLELLFDFSFHPHYTVGWVADWPIFGSLFTLLLPCVLVIRRPGRIAAGAFACVVALLIWSNTYLTDRYLVAVLPMFAATTAALIVQIHRLGWVARAGLIPLVALQLVWGADTWVWSGKKSIEDTMSLARSGWEGRLDSQERFPYWRTFRAVSEATPEDANILIRGSRPTLGIDRDVVEDLQWNQALLYYEPLTDPRQLWELYHRVGITHLLWLPNVHYSGTIQSSVLFAMLVHGTDQPVTNIDRWRLMELPERAPAPAAAPIRVLTRSLRFYPDGLYHLEDLHIYGRMEGREDAPEQDAVPLEKLGRGDAAFEGMLEQTDAIVLGNKASLSTRAQGLLDTRFVRVEKLERARIYLRRELVASVASGS